MRPARIIRPRIQPGWLGGGAGGGSQAAPKTIPGLMAWYTAGAGVTTVSGKVSAWADQSGVGDSNRNLAQATAANRPTFNASDANFNNLPTMSFARADPDSLVPGGAWSSSIPNPGTIFSVHLVTSLSSQVTYYDDRVINGGYTLVQTLGAGFGAGAGTTLASGTDNTLNKATVYGVVFNGASTALYDSAKTAVATGNGGSGTSTGLVVGLSGGAASGLQGTIAEIIVYSGALTSAQRNILWTYLGTKYAISIGT